jgi:hypothetical protein
MGVADSLRRLSPAQGAYAKMKIQQLLYEIEYPQYSTNQMDHQAFDNNSSKYTTL